MNTAAPTPDWQSADGSVQLYCADCREILPRLTPASVDMVVTDPPYGHRNNDDDLIARREVALGWFDSFARPRPIANDGPEANEMFRATLPMLSRLLRDGCCCCCCCCCGGGPDPQFARWSLWMDEVFDFKQMVVWDKGPMGMGWHYRRSYETVLVAKKRGGPCRWHADSADIENIIRPGSGGIRKIIPTAKEHPTPKPPELAAHFMKLHTIGGDVVLDPFSGAGWVGVAAARLGRRFIGIEIDRRWFDLAVHRISSALLECPGQLFYGPGAGPPAARSDKLPFAAGSE